MHSNCLCDKLWDTKTEIKSLYSGLYDTGTFVFSILKQLFMLE